MKKSKLVGALLVVGMLSACGHANKHSIYFDSGSSKLSQAGKNSLKYIAKAVNSKDRWIRGEDGRLAEPKNIHLTGLTDKSGSKEMNKKISDRRVLAVKQELIKLGVNPMYISSTSRGEGYLDKRGKARQAERRVDVLYY